jgi:hypothetical protein
MDGDSGSRGPGFLFHGRPHPGSPGVSDVSSAGIARIAPGCGKTCRKDVLRGVYVPVVPGAARRARPVPRRQAQRGEQVPARRAGLGRRVEAVDRDHAPPGPFRLVLDHAAEGAPAAVGNAPGQGMVAGHVPDGEMGAGLGVARLGMLVVVALAAPCQGLVPHDPNTAERTVQYAFLFGCQVDTALVSRSHVPIISGGVIVDKQARERRERRFLPGLKAGVSTPPVR